MKKIEELESLVRNLINEQKCKVTPEKEPANIIDCANVIQLPNVQEEHVSSEDSQSNPTGRDILSIKGPAGESKTANETKCDICQKILKSTICQPMMKIST